MRIGIVNGPNLGRLGRRAPDVYGSDTLDALVEAARAHARRREVDLEAFQSNHEGALIDFLEEHGDALDGLIINPGALTHYGLSLRDAVAQLTCPVIEVHLSNVHARERFRRLSVLSPVTRGQIIGLGGAGYRLAIDAIVDILAGPAEASDRERGGDTP